MLIIEVDCLKVLHVVCILVAKLGDINYGTSNSDDRTLSDYVAIRGFLAPSIIVNLISHFADCYKRILLHVKLRWNNRSKSNV